MPNEDPKYVNNSTNKNNFDPVSWWDPSVNTPHNQAYQTNPYPEGSTEWTEYMMTHGGSGPGSSNRANSPNNPWNETPDNAQFNAQQHTLESIPYLGIGLRNQSMRLQNTNPYYMRFGPDDYEMYNPNAAEGKLDPIRALANNLQNFQNRANPYDISQANVMLPQSNAMLDLLQQANAGQNLAGLQSGLHFAQGNEQAALANAQGNGRLATITGTQNARNLANNIGNEALNERLSNESAYGNAVSQQRGQLLSNTADELNYGLRQRQADQDIRNLGLGANDTIYKTENELKLENQRIENTLHQTFMKNQQMAQQMNADANKQLVDDIGKIIKMFAGGF